MVSQWSSFTMVVKNGLEENGLNWARVKTKAHGSQVEAKKIGGKFKKLPPEVLIAAAASDADPSR